MILTITLNPALDKVYSIDDFKNNHVFRTKEMTETAGGKGLNVTRVAKLLDEDVTATGFLGGHIGNFIRNEVTKLDIKEQFIEVEGNTRMCINITDQKNNTTTEILEDGPDILKKEIKSFLQRYEILIEKADIVTASGSLPPGLPVNFYKTLSDYSNDKNTRFLLDTSGEYLKKGIAGKPYLIKPNEEEIKSLFKINDNKFESYKKVLRRLKDKGVKIPIISLGKKGSYALVENKVYHFTPPKVKPLNTVGSGDAFIAGCAIGLKREYHVIDSIKLGMACGVANTQFFKTGIVSKDLVEKLVEEIIIKKVK